MKLKFKRQAYQTAAVEAVVNCFTGQPLSTGLSYRIDPGRAKETQQMTIAALEEMTGFKNSDIALPSPKVLENIQKVWARPVCLETVVEGRGKLLKFDGEKHSEKNLGP